LSFRDFWEGIETNGLYYSIDPLHHFEIGFVALSYLLSRLSRELAWYFFAICFISLSLKAAAVARLSIAPSLSALWYFSWYYMLLEMNAARAGIAAAILLLGTQQLMR